jgi:hypothetical protein
VCTRGLSIFFSLFLKNSVVMSEIESRKKKAAAFIIIHQLLTQKNKKKPRQRRWWITKLFHNKLNDNSSSLLSTLKFDESTGQYKHFPRMSSEDFEIFINLVGPKIQKNYLLMIYSQ